MGRQKINNQGGFTIIEVLVTLLVFSIGLVAIYTLSESNLHSVRNNFRNTLAANLGREAIELIRNQRDSNWLAIEANADCDPSDALAICTWDNGLKANYVSVSFSEPEPVVLACASFDQCLSLRESRIYVHHDIEKYYVSNLLDPQDPEDVYTSMNRVVRLQAICRDLSKDLNEFGGEESIANLAECLSGTKIGVQATVRLEWYSLNKKKSLDIVEKIYNWR